MPKTVFTDAYVSAVDQLTAMRKARNISQTELADRIGKTQQFVSLMERRERRLDLVEFMVLVRALGGDPEATLLEILRGLPKDLAI